MLQVESLQRELRVAFAEAESHKAQAEAWKRRYEEIKPLAMHTMAPLSQTTRSAPPQLDSNSGAFTERIEERAFVGNDRVAQVSRKHLTSWVFLTGIPVPGILVETSNGCTYTFRLH